MLSFVLLGVGVAFQDLSWLMARRSGTIGFIALQSRADALLFSALMTGNRLKPIFPATLGVSEHG